MTAIPSAEVVDTRGTAPVRKTFKTQDQRELELRIAFTVVAAALGAMAIGAVAIGALAIGRLSVGRARFGRLDVGDLRIGRVQRLRRPF